MAVVGGHLDHDDETRRAAVARMRELVPSDQLRFLMELSIGPSPRPGGS